MPFQPGVFDIFVYQFSDWSMNFGWRINEFPVDTTGFKAAMTVRSEASNAAVICYLSTENGRISTTEQPGWVVCKLDKQTTGELPSSRYVYDLVVDDGSTTWPLSRGRFVVRGGVTQGDVPNVAKGLNRG